VHNDDGDNYYYYYYDNNNNNNNNNNNIHKQRLKQKFNFACLMGCKTRSCTLKEQRGLRVIFRTCVTVVDSS
jgi:hypothetical protein